MAAKRTILLLGTPHINEDGVAGAEVKPGQLVKGVSSIVVHATAGGAAARAFALEREELGKGIDTTYGTETPNYASGDVVKVGVFKAGERVLARIASGQNIAADNFLESAGDGTLRVYASGAILGRALEAVDNSAGPSDAFIRVEVM